MAPNTLMFMLRWQSVPLVFGIAFVGLSAYGLTTFKGDPPDAPWSTLGGDLAVVLMWVGGALGAYLIWLAWSSAAKLRRGA